MTEAAVVRGWMGALALGCAALAPGVHAQSMPDGPVLHLLSGSQGEIRLGKPLERIAIGNPEVADALLLKGRGAAGSLLIVAKKPGAASIMVWTQGGTAITYNVQVEAEARGAGSPDLAVQGGTAVLTGQVRDVYSLARARKAAAAAGGAEPPKGGSMIDNTAMAVPGTVQVDVRVVEFSKTVLKEAGFSFSRTRGGFTFGAYSPSSLSQATPSWLSSTASSSSGLTVQSTQPVSTAFNLLLSSVSKGLFADLSLIESNGLARVLAEPSLVALSGQSANFLAGGEIPIPVPQALGTTTIEYKPFGIGLTVSPTILSENRIALKVAPEASDLDFSRGITLNGATVPAIVTRRADTTVELGDGESFVIGGLVSRTTLSNVDKLPFLGDLPIIGSFFKRLNYNQEERELVIIVTPRLVRPMARNAPIDKMLPGQAGGQDRDQAGLPVWQPFVLGAADSAAMPGFSR
ncbi:type II and III secretion system protein family protein [Ralstonia solanacearum]|uniref:Type II and III secretion system protein family protein n=1 Tax=Ralstonia solanacearum TaxID=305 RepID=A0AAE3T5P2_RALSL|nr:type II and III secretion system protein family protein [Ralstonia solanacearum]MBB6584338.1 type II and III secretion system protein family protein [Ralstonia solanacearum]MDB0524396.1 type II and III secretion system protein family protein [Ralstonia solanacearum]